MSCPDDELSLRPDAAGWLAIAEVYLDLYAEADAHASRALGLARASGRGDPLHRLYPVLPRVWYVRGKLAEATELLDGAIEAGRLLGSPPALAGNLFNRSVVAVAAGDLDIALATAEESVELTRDLDEGFVTAWAAARLAGVLFETGQPDRAIELLLGRAGGEELTLIPGGWRAYCLELLTRCWLALDRPGEAGRAAALAEAMAAAVQLPLAATWAGRAAAAVALDAGDAGLAAERALASADAADAAGAPIEAALSRTIAGRALAETGEKDRAVAELQRAAAALDACGALALPPKRGARAGKARPSSPPAHPAGQGQRGRHRVADRTRTPGGVARRRPQDQPADRRGTVPEPEDRRDPPAQHLPQDRRHHTRRPRARRRTHRPNSEPATEIGPPGLPVLLVRRRRGCQEPKAVMYRAGVAHPNG